MVPAPGDSSPPRTAIYTNHPAADIFPLMDEAAFALLKADIAEHGLLDSITVFDGQIIDGRNRYRACTELGISSFYDPLEECSDPIAFVLSRNLHRRHLTTSQRAAVAVAVEAIRAEAAKERQRDHGGTAPGKAKNTSGKKTISDKPAPTARDEAAKALQVSPSSVGKAKRIAKESPETFEAVKAGTMTLAQAEKKLDKKPIIIDAVCKEKPAVTCPVCGGSEFDEDGDCLVCREPRVKAMSVKPEKTNEPDKDRTDAAELGRWIKRDIKALRDLLVRLDGSDDARLNDHLTQARSYLKYGVRGVNQVTEAFKRANLLIAKAAAKQ